jgi:hypothetical protein
MHTMFIAPLAVFRRYSDWLVGLFEPLKLNTSRAVSALCAVAGSSSPVSSASVQLLHQLERLGDGREAARARGGRPERLGVGQRLAHRAALQEVRRRRLRILRLRLAAAHQSPKH